MESRRTQESIIMRKAIWALVIGVVIIGGIVIANRNRQQAQTPSAAIKKAAKQTGKSTGNLLNEAQRLTNQTSKQASATIEKAGEVAASEAKQLSQQGQTLKAQAQQAGQQLQQAAGSETASQAASQAEETKKQVGF